MVRRISRQSRETLPGAKRERSLTIHRRREHEHLQVVRGVGHDALALGRLLIRLPCLQAGLHRVAPAADLAPGVRRHVIEMTGSGHRTPEIGGAPFRARRLRRQLCRVDVEMACARMTDVEGERAFEDAQHLEDVRVADVERARTRQQQERRFRV